MRGNPTARISPPDPTPASAADEYGAKEQGAPNSLSLSAVAMQSFQSMLSFVSQHQPVMEARDFHRQYRADVCNRAQDARENSGEGCKCGGLNF